MGAPFGEALRISRKPACSLCGSLKRYWMNRLARDMGCAAVATGHNLDDETAFLLGNVLHWQMDYIRTQSPARGEEPGLTRKIKPLYRLTDEETRLYAELEGLSFVREECPRSGGATSHLYKRFLDRLAATAR